MLELHDDYKMHIHANYIEFNLPISPELDA